MKSGKPCLQLEFRLVFISQIGNVLRNEVVSKALRYLRSLYSLIQDLMDPPLCARHCSHGFGSEQTS